MCAARFVWTCPAQKQVRSLGSKFTLKAALEAVEPGNTHISCVGVIWYFDKILFLFCFRVEPASLAPIQSV